jgi:hypothetical protein
MALPENVIGFTLSGRKLPDPKRQEQRKHALHSHRPGINCKPGNPPQTAKQQRGPGHRLSRARGSNSDQSWVKIF